LKAYRSFGAKPASLILACRVGAESPKHGLGRESRLTRCCHKPVGSFDYPNRSIDTSEFFGVGDTFVTKEFGPCAVRGIG
jgi:hypothetical protein